MAAARRRAAALAALLALAAARLLAAARIDLSTETSRGPQTRGPTLEAEGVGDPIFLSECLDELLSVDDDTHSPMQPGEADVAPPDMPSLIECPSGQAGGTSAAAASTAVDVMLAARDAQRSAAAAPGHGAEASGPAAKRRRTSPVARACRPEKQPLRRPNASARLATRAPPAPPPGARGWMTFPVKSSHLVYMQAALDGALLAADCPLFRPSEVEYEVKPPSEAKPGSMLNVSAPWHGFMPVMVPQGWTAGATIRVQYEVPSDATPSRDLIALQKRRYIDKLNGRLVAKADHMAPMTWDDAKICFSFVDRLTWLELLQFQLSRLPKRRCLPMRLSFGISDLPQLRWEKVEVNSTFKRYIEALPPASALRCAKLAADVALQIAPARQRALIALSYHAHFVSIAADRDMRFPRCDVAFATGLLQGVENATERPWVPLQLRKMMWENGCPELRFHSAVRIEKMSVRPSEIVSVASSDGNVSAVMPASLPHSHPVWALYAVPRVSAANMLSVLFLYSMLLSEERRRVAEFGVELPVRQCFALVEEALHAMLQA